MGLNLSALTDPARRPNEIVERKGLGHPDTICDALAEEVSRALSRFYCDRFGLVLHHNVDKVLLCGGVSRPAFGGGEIVAPIEIFLAGRATREFKGVMVPVDDLAVATAGAWLAKHLPNLDVSRHVRLHSRIHPGSADLAELFLRQRDRGVYLANDTSIGVGFAPASPLERAVTEIEAELRSPFIKRRHPSFGEDIKVMGARAGDTVDITVSCALVGRHLQGLDDYRLATGEIAGIARGIGERALGHPPAVAVNAADDLASGSVYLTVSGTSAEAGDDGEAGRGNRANGLITPHRPMTMESVAGKNPVTHVGKLYNVAARRIAAAAVEKVDGVAAVECYLVSRIGHPVREPQLIELRLYDEQGRPPESLRPAMEPIVRAGLAELDGLWQHIMAGEIELF